MKNSMSGMSRADDDDGEEGLQIEDLYLIFRLGQEEYGISIGDVTEIVGRQNITQVPNMPEYVRGVINLRGQVIPVIDVRIRFGLAFREYDDRTCSIVISVNGVQFGLMVDEVEEVISIDRTRIASPPMAQSNRFIRGIGQADGNGRVKLLLAVEPLLRDNPPDTEAAAS